MSTERVLIQQLTLILEPIWSKFMKFKEDLLLCMSLILPFNDYRHYIHSIAFILGLNIRRKLLKRFDLNFLFIFHLKRISLVEWTDWERSFVGSEAERGKEVDVEKEFFVPPKKKINRRRNFSSRIWQREAYEIELSPTGCWILKFLPSQIHQLFTLELSFEIFSTLFFCHFHSNSHVLLFKYFFPKLRNKFQIPFFLINSLQ